MHLGKLSGVERCQNCGELQFPDHECSRTYLTMIIGGWLSSTDDIIFDGGQESQISCVRATDAEMAASSHVRNLSKIWYRGEMIRLAVIQEDNQRCKKDGRRIWPSGKYQLVDVFVHLQPVFVPRVVEE